MYKLSKVKGIVRIPPPFFNLPFERAAKLVLSERFIGTTHPDIGVIIAVLDVKVSEEGRVIPGDGSTYHDAEFYVLSYKPEVKEVVEGQVVQIQRYGLTVTMGPMEGFAHISQVMDERVVHDPQRRALIGENTRRIIEVGDTVRARIVSVAYSGPLSRPRAQLTLRQPYLGKEEWYTSKEEKKKK